MKKTVNQKEPVFGGSDESVEVLMRNKNKQRGFTLIEMLLVVLLLALTVGLTSDMLLSLIRSNTKTQVINEIEQQSNFVTLKLEKELRDALDASTGANDSLIITLRSNSQVTYRLTSGSVLQRQIGGGEFVNLTSDLNPGGVRVSCLSPSPCFNIVGNNPKSVVTRLIFNQAQVDAGPTYKGDVKIESTITIRGDY